MQQERCCDQEIKLIPGMAFFFSAVAAVESKVKKNHASEDTEEDGDLNNTSHKQQVVYWPTISYWMAVQSQNGTHVSTVTVHSALLEIGMDVTAKALPDCKKEEKNSHLHLCVRHSKITQITFCKTKSIFHLLRDCTV